MNLTPKESSLLKDLRSQEQLCVEKYNKYAADACDVQLKDLFTQIGQQETTHVQTLDSIASGTVPGTGGGQSQKPQTTFTASNCDTAGRQADRYLCADALAMEKHVSAEYDTCIFEFSDTAVRDALNHIQKEEQQHGDEIYKYMSTNNMYN